MRATGSITTMTGHTQEHPDVAKSDYTGESLAEWAERMAATAPPLRQEQKDIVIAALVGVLKR